MAPAAWAGTPRWPSRIRYADAIAQLRTVLNLDPEFEMARLELGIAYALQSRYAEATLELRSALERLDDNPLAAGMLGYCQARSGDGRAARQILDALIDSSSQCELSCGT